MNNTTLHGLALARDEPSIATVLSPASRLLLDGGQPYSCVVASLCIPLTVATVPPYCHSFQNRD